MGRGRRPIGERAMTPAEKQRRYRERKFGNRPKRPPVTKSTAAKAAAIDPASAARIRELEAELARERARRGTLDDPASLPKSYRERFEAMVRRQNREFEAR